MYLDLQLLSLEARTWLRVVACKSYNPNPSPAHTLPQTKPRVATNKASCGRQQNVTTLASCSRQRKVTNLTTLRTHCHEQILVWSPAKGYNPNSTPAHTATNKASCRHEQSLVWSPAKGYKPNSTPEHTATNKASCGRLQKVAILT